MNESSANVALPIGSIADDFLPSHLEPQDPGTTGGAGGWYPLSYGQEALWFLWQLAPQSPAYNVLLTAELCGALHSAALRRSLQVLSDRHPCLRTQFTDEGGRASQRVLDHHVINLVEVEATGWSHDRLRDVVRAEAQRSFDLTKNATLRAYLFRRSADRHVMLLATHHIVSDPRSLFIVMDELRVVYTAEISGEPAILPPLSISYEDHVRKQRLDSDAGATQPQLRYWKEALAGELPVLDLPLDRQRPPLQSFRGGTVVARIGADLTRDLERLAAAEGATLFMVLLTAYQVLLHRYSGQDCILAGMPASGRVQPELADLVGDFADMLPIRADLTGNRSFRQCLSDTRNAVIGALEHQDCPFSVLVDQLQPARDISRSPIFQTTFTLQSFDRFPALPGAEGEPAIPFGNLLLEPWPLPQQDGQFDLNLEMQKDSSNRLISAWKYAADLFDPDTVACIAASFETLLRQMVTDPGRGVEDLSLLPPDAIADALAAGQGPVVELPAEATVCSLFDAIAEQHGSAIALTCEDASLTYAGLRQRVDQIARALVALGVGRETLVAVVMFRGLDFVTALLAIMRAGGAFLPIAPCNPPQRTRSVLDASGAALVLTEPQFAPGLESALEDCPADHRPPVLNFEALPAASKDVVLPPYPAGSDLAYIMYTSGSTGQPKGVMVEHPGMINHLLAKVSDLDVLTSDVIAQNAPQSFDVMVWQCLTALIAGARVAVIPDTIAEDPAALLLDLRRTGVTILQVVPSMMRALIEEAEAYDGAAPDLGKLRWIVPTGEALPTDLCRRWLELYPAVPVINAYGSAECSDDQCHYPLYRLDAADAALPVISVGRPIANMSAHVLDRNLAPVPAGVVGELYIGGIGVGRGYRGDPVRTAQAFIDDPFSSVPGARFYKTNDMARRRADGLIDFLGRVDHMIKLNGTRIEPGEIETVLCRQPDIQAAVVLARPNRAGELRLVAYIVRPRTESALDAEELRRALTAILPFSMIPAIFVCLPALPLTANGKIDQRRLPVPDWGTASDLPMVAPRNAMEATIASIWARLLQREQIGVTEDFFALGGDSIRSMQVAARCRHAGLPVEPLDLFLYRTVAALAEHLAGRVGDRATL